MHILPYLVPLRRERHGCGKSSPAQSNNNCRDAWRQSRRYDFFPAGTAECYIPRSPINPSFGLAPLAADCPIRRRVKLSTSGISSERRTLCGAERQPGDPMSLSDPRCAPIARCSHDLPGDAKTRFRQSHWIWVAHGKGTVSTHSYSAWHIRSSALWNFESGLNGVRAHGRWAGPGPGVEEE